MRKRMKLTRREVVAMWLFGEEYAQQRLGAIAFYEQLPAGRKECINEFLTQLDAATPPEAGGTP